MADTITIQAERREHTGKGAARKLRQAGQVPAVIYGSGRDAEALTVPKIDLDKYAGSLRGSTVVSLAMGGQTVSAVVREIQRHPTRKTITHVDFYEIHAGEKISLDVPVTLTGAPDGVRNQGGVLEQFIRELEIEVLPKDIPDRIEVDVTDLRVHGSIHVRDLQVPDARILTDPNRTVCTVVPPRVEEEPTVAVTEEEEGVEPELIRKRAEEEEGETEEDTTEE
jgi:large subunit ribosomal protein L25